MQECPIRVTIKVHTQPNRPRRPRTFKWIGYERKLAGLWETGYFM